MSADGVGVGTVVTLAGGTFVVSRRIGREKVLVEQRDNGEARILTLRELAAALAASADPEGSEASHVPATDLGSFSDEEWATAQRRFAVIQPLLNRQYRTRADVAAAAKAAGCDASTIYEWIKAYQDSGFVSALVPKKAGRKPGRTTLDDVREKIVAEAIEQVFLDKQRHTIEQVITEVNRVCKSRKLKPPSPNVVRDRVARQPERLVHMRRGRRDIVRDKLTAQRGSIPGGDHPLALVQIDHTPADLEVVDEDSRRPMGKPWITLAIDVFSRMVVGFYLSMERPNAAAVGMCISMGVLPKDGYLRELGVEGDWPAFGKMRVIHSDNGAEFKGTMMERAAAEHDMILKLRPGRQPNYGGHIERLMRTANDMVHGLPGTTFANPRDRKGYDSEREAVYTLREFEAHLVDWIVNQYNSNLHGAISMTPRRKWQLGLEGDRERPGIGMPEKVEDEAKFRLDFMPFELRNIRNYGVLVDGVYYWDEVLKDRISLKEKTTYVFRYDPRDVSVLHFWDPQLKAYFEIPYRDLSHPPTSRWELRDARSALRAEGREHFDEDALFETILRLRRRVEEAKNRTKAARKERQRVRTTMAVAARRRAGERGAARSEASCDGGDRVEVDPAPVAGMTERELAAMFAEDVTPFENSGDLRRPNS